MFEANPERWIQGQFFNIEKSCLVGGIYRQSSDSGEIGEVLDRLHSVITKTVPEEQQLISVSCWNDLPGRSVEEVISVLKQAAELA